MARLTLALAALAFAFHLDVSLEQTITTAVVPCTSNVALLRPTACCLAYDCRRVIRLSRDVRVVSPGLRLASHPAVSDGLIPS